MVAGGMVDLILDTKWIEPTSDTTACGTGIATATLEPPNAPAVVMVGRYAVNFRRREGQWRCVIDMYTIDTQRPAG